MVLGPLPDTEIPAASFFAYGLNFDKILRARNLSMISELASGANISPQPVLSTTSNEGEELSLSFGSIPSDILSHHFGTTGSVLQSPILSLHNLLFQSSMECLGVWRNRGETKRVL
jgi:hypothetical protein